jgi:hypothetical protein
LVGLIGTTIGLGLGISVIKDRCILNQFEELQVIGSRGKVAKQATREHEVLRIKGLNMSLHITVFRHRVVEFLKIIIIRLLVLGSFLMISNHVSNFIHECSDGFCPTAIQTHRRELLL